MRLCVGFLLSALLCANGATPSLSGYQWMFRRAESPSIEFFDPETSTTLSQPPHDSNGADPCFAPDGQHYAFVSRQVGGVSALQVAAAAEPGGRQISEPTASCTGPRWSSGRLVCEVVGGPPQIAVLREDGSDWKLLGEGSAPALSPDGTKIAFTMSGPEGIAIWTMNADGTERKRWNKDLEPAGGGMPDWSPDGRQIAYVHYLDRALEVFVANADGTGAHQVSKRGRAAATPSWSPDGAWIAFRLADPLLQETQIAWVVHPDGSGERAVAGAHPEGRIAWRPFGEKPVRDWQNAQLKAAPFVFTGDEWPALTIDPPSAEEAYLGKHTTRITYYDRNFQVVAKPQQAGPYGVVVEYQPEQGRPTRRLLTLFRVASALAPDAKWTPEFATTLGISPESLQREAELIARVGKNRPLAELVKDSQFARLLTGLVFTGEQPPSSDHAAPIRKNEDALAVERQWWVNLKERLGCQIHLNFSGPRKLDSAAPVLRLGTPAEAGFKPDAVEKMEAVCQAWAADSDQAFAVCIARHGVVVFHRAFGMREGRPMTVETKSWMASVTKTTSATCAMMLVDAGLMTLDDPLSRYLPVLRGADPSVAVTLRHCLTHTAGLHRWLGWSDELPDADARVAEVLPLSRVGVQWAYNGQGYTLAWKAMEAVTGEALPMFQLHHLLGPLGLEHTDVIGAHADMMSTPMDMARFAQMLLQRGRYGAWEFMRPETFEQMLPQKLTGILGSDAIKTFGLGLDGAPGSGNIGHGTASAATFQIDLQEQLVMIICRNAMGTNWDKYAGKFTDIVRANLLPWPAP